MIYMKICGENIEDIVHPCFKEKSIEELEKLAAEVLDTYVSYYHKSETKYPARAYVLLGVWQERNLRPMALTHAPLIYRRPITEGEAATILSSMRQVYYQYENWAHLVQDEIRTCTPTETIMEILESYQGYSLNNELVDPSKIQLYAEKSIQQQAVLEL